LRRRAVAVVDAVVVVVVEVDEVVAVVVAVVVEVLLLALGEAICSLTMSSSPYRSLGLFTFVDFL
jgi:hypothetical protein